MLKSFATDLRTIERRKNLTAFVEKLLQKITTIPTLELSDVALPEQTDTARDDFQSHIRSLHAALSLHCLCHESNTITANLRLNNCCTRGEIENSVNFRLLFLDHPHSRISDPRCQWQDARVCVVQRRFASSVINTGINLVPMLTTRLGLLGSGVPSQIQRATQSMEN